MKEKLWRKIVKSNKNISNEEEEEKEEAAAGKEKRKLEIGKVRSEI